MLAQLKSGNEGKHSGGSEFSIAPPSASRTVRLLVVDDHAVVRRGAISWLQTQAGYEVVGEAETPTEALAITMQERPHVVLLDVLLGQQGAVAAAHEIVRDCPQSTVVAFSASSDPVHVKSMLAAGALAYVLKTSDPETLLRAIRAVIRGVRFLDPGLSEMVVDELDLFPPVSRRCKQVLTPRETQVLHSIMIGYTPRQIADQLRIKTTSVNTHRARMCAKLGLRGRAELVRYGLASGLSLTA